MKKTPVVLASIVVLSLSASPASAGLCTVPTIVGNWAVRGAAPMYPGRGHNEVYTISNIDMTAECVDDSMTQCSPDGQTCSTSSGVRLSFTMRVGTWEADFEAPRVHYGPPSAVATAGDGWLYADTITGGNPTRIWLRSEGRHLTGYFDVSLADGSQQGNWVSLRRPEDGAHDATGDRREDILLSPAQDWQAASLGVARIGAGFDFRSPSVPSLWDMVSQGAQMIAGDFDGDGLQDFALVRGAADTVPVFFNKGDGTYRATNARVRDFPAWARDRNATAVTGDFNGDGMDDIALGGGEIESTPIALSRGDGSFETLLRRADAFAVYARQAGAKLLAGDFDGDGFADLALTGGLGWQTVPVCFTRGKSGNGVQVENTRTPESVTFAGYATQPGATPVAGDFNGDGKTDLALTAGQGWYTIPVMRSWGDGTFSLSNATQDYFPSWATQENATPIAGDFDDDGRDDIALVGGKGWNTIPVAYGQGSGTNFTITNFEAPTMAAVSAIVGVRPVTRVVRPAAIDWIDVPPRIEWPRIGLARWVR